MNFYTSAIYNYKRRQTREVKVGSVGIGGNNPIRVQSMTISDTKDTDAVVKESIGLVEAGCEIVRITAPTIHHAENLKNIRDELRKQNIHVPLVADIHFTPQAAMIAADYVDKVRINPGNYADRKLFAVKEYSDGEYESELQRMAEKFIPLVQKCKKNGIAMRIGTNHGSLSDRIMNRFGDTPEGMVESALEFARICESESYHDLIFSMKASSPFIMMAAYRLLAQRMNELGMNYPFHLGVTEAGEGEDGRVKSAIGIGGLLEDGIGDTIRVSLTEDSIHEIPVAKALVKKFNSSVFSQLGFTQNQASDFENLELFYDPIHRERRPTDVLTSSPINLGEGQAYGIFATVENTDLESTVAYFKYQKEDESFPDILIFEKIEIEPAIQYLDQLKNLRNKQFFGYHTNSIDELQKTFDHFDSIHLEIKPDLPTEEFSQVLKDFAPKKSLLDLRFSSLTQLESILEYLRGQKNLILSFKTSDPVHDYRKLRKILDENTIDTPIHLNIEAKNLENPVLEVSSALGALLVDGTGDSIQINGLSLHESVRLSFNILQATRLRISKAEFIACPSCGRTLFDLQSTTQRIKQKTAHLKGVKIAIMGCIVNGPGEMADADFGYVGGGPGKIHLYVGKDCVEKNIPSEIADEKLIELIKKHDRWVEPSAA